MDPGVGVSGTESGSEHLGVVVVAEQTPSPPHMHVRLEQTELIAASQRALASVQPHVVPPTPSAAWQCGFSAVHPGSVSVKSAVFTQV